MGTVSARECVAGGAGSRQKGLLSDTDLLRETIRLIDLRGSTVCCTYLARPSLLFKQGQQIAIGTAGREADGPQVALTMKKDGEPKLLGRQR